MKSLFINIIIIYLYSDYVKIMASWVFPLKKYQVFLYKECAMENIRGPNVFLYYKDAWEKD